MISATGARFRPRRVRIPVKSIPDQADRFASSLASSTKRRPPMALLRISLTLLMGLGIFSSCVLAEPPEDKPGRRTDLYGDPLPEGAIARLGSPGYVHKDMVYE